MMPSHRRPWDRPVRILVPIALVVVTALAAIAWRCSDLILFADAPPSLREQRVFAAEPGLIRLSSDRESLAPGVWALEWSGGFGRVGRIVRADSETVVREFRAVTGRPPVGGWASLRGVARSADPMSQLGLPFESVSIAGPLGTYPAWWVAGPGSTWVVYVHGRGANRAEGLRTLGVLAARGLPGLLVTYQNDPGAPASPDGFSHLGLTEWEDLEAAVRHALDHGASDVVLAGYSMGGQVVVQFLARSPLAGRVRAVVLESPLLDWDATLALRARAMGVPAIFKRLGQQAASARAGIDWDRLGAATRAEGARPATLLFHDAHDDIAPVTVSEAWARARPAQVTLVRVEGGNHVEAWNVDPVSYSARLNAWCESHRIGAPLR